MNPMQKGLPDLHGTHVAGIIGATKNNSLGGYGVSPNVDIISIDVFSRSWSSSDFTVAEGILEAIRQKAQVINMRI
jgi:serine protease